MGIVLPVLVMLMFAAPGMTLSLAVGVPDPARCTVPHCLTLCPTGDIVFTLTVRDFNSAPVADAQVVIDLLNCTGVSVCATNGSEPYIYDAPSRTLRGFTNAAGVATFPIKAGGVCVGETNVIADGVSIRRFTGVSSPDQDANLTVDGADILAVNAKLGTFDVTADFDCDGVVTNSDLDFATAHGGHTCQAPTSVHRKSWGELKQIYR